MNFHSKCFTLSAVSLAAALVAPDARAVTIDFEDVVTLAPGFERVYGAPGIANDPSTPPLAISTPQISNGFNFDWRNITSPLPPDLGGGTRIHGGCPKAC